MWTGDSVPNNGNNYGYWLDNQEFIVNTDNTDPDDY